MVCLNVLIQKSKFAETLKMKFSTNCKSYFFLSMESNTGIKSLGITKVTFISLLVKLRVGGKINLI